MNRDMQSPAPCSFPARPDRDEAPAVGLAESKWNLADSEEGGGYRLRDTDGAALSSTSTSGARRYSVGVMPKRSLKARLNGPIDP
jgi:hypothetical protein